MQKYSYSFCISVFQLRDRIGTLGFYPARAPRHACFR